MSELSAKALLQAIDNAVHDRVIDVNQANALIEIAAAQSSASDAAAWTDNYIFLHEAIRLLRRHGYETTADRMRALLDEIKSHAVPSPQQADTRKVTDEDVEKACRAYDDYAAQSNDVSASHYAVRAALESFAAKG